MHNFKKALQSILIFVFIIALISGPLIAVYFAQNKLYYQDAPERDALAGKLDTLVVGASEGMRGIVPDILDEELGTYSYNLAGALMTMTGRYELLKFEASRNEIKTVILEVSYDSMSRDREEEGAEGDLYVLGRWSSWSQRVRYISEAFTIDELPALFYDTLNRGFTVTAAALGWTDEAMQTAQYANRGYVITPRTDLTHSSDEYQAVYHTKAWKSNVIPDNLKQLQNISDLCKQQNIELVMVTLPISKYTLLQHTGLQKLSDFYADFAKENGWQYYDANLLRDRDTLFSEAEAFNDEVHIGSVGAYYMTKQLSELIRMQRSGEDTAPLFYDSFAQLEQSYGFQDDLAAS